MNTEIRKMLLIELLPPDMTTKVETNQIFRESIMLGIIMFFWTILSWFALEPIIGTGIRYTGLIIALFYAIVQGSNLEYPQPHPNNIADLLRENVKILSVSGPWFLAAIATYVISILWAQFGLPGAFTSPADSFAFVFVATGISTAVLYLVAVGQNRIQTQL